MAEEQPKKWWENITGVLVGIAAFLGYRKGDFASPGVAIGHAVFALATIYFYTTTL